jgi:hypothetical protein
MTGARIHWLKAEGKMNAEKTRGAARQLWMRILMEASYELKFELQVQVMRLISGATLDCQAYMPVHTTPHLDLYIYHGPRCTAASDWAALRCS